MTEFQGHRFESFPTEEKVFSSLYRRACFSSINALRAPDVTFRLSCSKMVTKEMHSKLQRDRLQTNLDCLWLNGPWVFSYYTRIDFYLSCRKQQYETFFSDMMIILGPRCISSFKKKICSFLLVPFYLLLKIILYLRRNINEKWKYHGLWINVLILSHIDYV